MPKLYARWMRDWEHKLATRDTNRVVRPFEWGLDWLDAPPANGNSRQVMHQLANRALAESDDFFAYQTPRDYRLENGRLTFTSPLATPYPENNLVHATHFPARRDQGRAVVVLPQWNSDEQGHAGLCRLLNRFGITALRMSLAYHDRRMPPELQRADYHVSSNIGRTVHAGRQSIIDTRACVEWLAGQGYRRIGVLGTSLGSCIAFIAAAHDPRITTGVFNHVSMYFSDVVWTGLSTEHIMKGLAGEVTQDQLREFWAPISPASYLDRMRGRDLKSLLIWARHDSTFLPVYSLQVLENFRRRNLPHEVFTLPCGHYTTGQFPFNLLDGVVMCRFLSRNL
ncbi:MAG TPA: prolyl oligopeptidase family serine peptidase [Terriglobales bacterium]|nr:prolyl oligopeptidase family serine peptidase [Terriglobales bacterium]